MEAMLEKMQADAAKMEELKRGSSILMFAPTRSDREKAINNRHQLESQLTENKMVKEELDLLDTDAIVYKQIGPALVPQDLDEAKMAVGRRLEYIQKEWFVLRALAHSSIRSNRIDTSIDDMAKRTQQLQQAVVGAQQKLQAVSQAPGK